MEVAASTQRVFEIWVFVAGMYFVISYACAFGFSRLEKRMALHKA
jgi:ABC-type amino acid transport system permease subunit